MTYFDLFSGSAGLQKFYLLPRQRQTSLLLATILLFLSFYFPSISVAQDKVPQIRATALGQCATFFKTDRFGELEFTEAGSRANSSDRYTSCRIKVRATDARGIPIVRRKVTILYSDYAGSDFGCQYSEIAKPHRTDRNGETRFRFVVGRNGGGAVVQLRGFEDLCIVENSCCPVE